MGRPDFWSVVSDGMGTRTSPWFSLSGTEAVSYLAGCYANTHYSIQAGADPRVAESLMAGASSVMRGIESGGMEGIRMLQDGSVEGFGVTAS